MTKTRAPFALLAGLGALALSSCGGSGEQETSARTQPAGGGQSAPTSTGSGAAAGGAAATATFNDRGSKDSGTVRITPMPGARGVRFDVQARGLEPGFHGMHVHETGRCEPPTFMTAKGHLRQEGQEHGTHDGDLPSLYVGQDGTGTLQAVNDRMTLEDLTGNDGAAVMIHSGRENFAKIPARYGEPDQETLETGDAGSRLACAVVGR